MFTLLKALILDLKTMQEAAWYAQFGPIGGVAILTALFVKRQLTPGSAKAATERVLRVDAQKSLNRLWAGTTLVVVWSSFFHGSIIGLSASRKGTAQV